MAINEKYKFLLLFVYLETVHLEVGGEGETGSGAEPDAGLDLTILRS